MTRRTISEAATAATSIMRDDLTDNSRVLLDTGRIAIHDDCILALQPDGKWAREEFAAHMPEDNNETPETAAGDDTSAE